MILYAITASTSLDAKDLKVLLLWTSLTLLGAGILVLLFRAILKKDAGSSSDPPEASKPADADATAVRSWLAMALVSGLLLFAAASFFLADETLRSLLMGGVVASTGTVVAFYFASKASEETQKNLLNAAFGSVSLKVPDFRGMTVAQARSVADALRLVVVTSPASATDTDVVTASKPAVGATVEPGNTVTLTTGPQSPLTAQDLQAATSDPAAVDTGSVTASDPVARTPATTTGDTATVATDSPQ